MSERTLEEALAERNRLWEELQRQRALEQDVEYWRRRATDIERSRWWRAGKPLRLLKRLRQDPPGALEGWASALRRRRG